MGLHINNSYRGGTFDWMDAGEKIRSIRKAKGLTQIQLAKLIGVDQSSLSDIESKQARFSAELLMRLCDELEVSAEMLMRGADPVSWPFARVPMERFLSLSQGDRDYIEGRLIEALDNLDNPPPFRSISLRPASAKRKRAA